MEDRQYHDSLRIQGARPAQNHHKHDEHQRLAEEALLRIGSIAGSLDDVIYGAVTTSTECMLLKATIVRSSLVDDAVLTQIDGPVKKLSLFEFHQVAAACY
ncbi:hypothetical protein PI124_g23793 [Phytophthora idaei]|nr:hypothetical protein PI125_g26056 [Phytophthora idaei]KAG3123131.1 hypothetical protein PI126_g23849 [Phytophthora idaei]KAG3231112.1 hypothetical protein PI124_g23793 [Phytophthora idaei]